MSGMPIGVLGLYAKSPTENDSGNSLGKFTAVVQLMIQFNLSKTKIFYLVKFRSNNNLFSRLSNGARADVGRSAEGV